MSRPWLVFRVHHGRENMCMLVIMHVSTNVTAGESKINIVPIFCDGPGSISLGWGTFLNQLKFRTSRVSRGMGAKSWHDYFVAAGLAMGRSTDPRHSQPLPQCSCRPARILGRAGGSFQEEVRFPWDPTRHGYLPGWSRNLISTGL